ncbi:hypothetical protein [Sorangium cellulosum]|nr:hypothetical protein [Sorangium cellulosum]
MPRRTVEAVSERAAAPRPGARRGARATGAADTARAPAKRPLPPALAKNAARSAAMKRARLAEQARADIELIKRRRERIAEDFYDIGEALVRLKRPGVPESLGHKSFGDLCQAELGLSASKAAQLLAIVRSVPREQARSLGQERAAALLALAEATPEDDSTVTLASSVLKLPSGKRVDIATAPTRALREAAKEIRQAHAAADKPRRGLTTTAPERAAALALQRALRDLGLAEAHVAAVARHGGGAFVRIERVPLAELDLLRKALRPGRP